VKNLLDCHPESVVAAPDNSDGPARCGEAIQTLLAHAEAIAAETDQLLQLLVQDQGAASVSGTGKVRERYGDYPSYAVFLQNSKPIGMVCRPMRCPRCRRPWNTTARPTGKDVTFRRVTRRSNWLT